MRAVEGDDAVQTVADLDSGERHAAGARDDDGILPSAVDHGGVHSLERESVGGNHDRTGTHAGERDHRVFLTRAGHGSGERFLAAVERVRGDNWNRLREHTQGQQGQRPSHDCEMTHR